MIGGKKIGSWRLLTVGLSCQQEEKSTGFKQTVLNRLIFLSIKNKL